MELTAQRATLRLAETFTISRGSEDEAEVVQVAITHDGATGYGEAAPIERYAESAETALEWLEDVELGDDPFALDELDEQLPQGDRAARAAVDAALHDLQGKLTGLPVYRLLGVRPAGPPTSWTIWLGDPDDMARRTEKIANRGFKRLKLKLGGFDGLDVERVNAVRGVTDLPLMCDANEAWTLDEALEIIPQLDVEYVEQPLKAGDEDGADAEGALAGLDLRRRGLSHARRRRRVRGARARHQHQARQVRRHPRSGAHGARRARARARGDARLHGRVGSRHLRGRADREPDGPRRPRRQPPARGRPVAGRRVRRRRAASLRPSRIGCRTTVGC